MREAVLPDWWSDDCLDDDNLLPDVEFRVARFLSAPIALVRDPGATLSAASYRHAQLRRVRDVDRDRLAPAIHAAIQIAGAVLRNLRPQTGPVQMPPTDGLKWREAAAGAGRAFKLDDILVDLWGRGIPVVPLRTLPSPNFQGAACVVEGRPVILVAQKHDEPGHIAFIVGHETGHIAAGDCKTDQPVVDGDDEIQDDAEIEAKANLYATRALVRADSAPVTDATTFKQLATSAALLEKETGADASMIIYSWAARTGDYAKASMAVKALYRASGGKKLLRSHFDRHVDVASANESDRALLRCVHGDPDHDAAAD